MGQSSWGQEVTNRFFSSRKWPTRTRCDEIAKSLSGASTVSPVESPGSMSYTVVCTENPGLSKIVSFREPEAMLDEKTVKLAKEIHGDLVPEITYHGNVDGADPPLFIYSMPYLRGSSWIEMTACDVQMSADEEAKQKTFVQHLARYFARCWASPQVAEPQNQARQQEEIREKLVRLAEEPSSSILPSLSLSKLIESLPSLFSEDYPQVLTHNDFSVTNILVDEDKSDITGIVDWSLASIRPFGMDMDILYFATGFMTLKGWHDYSCKQLLQDTFWDEFWVVTGIEGKERQGRIRSLGQAAGQIGGTLRLAFKRNGDGSPSGEILGSESRMKQLRAWLS